jgi:hypothetical protein
MGNNRIGMDNSFEYFREYDKIICIRCDAAQRDQLPERPSIEERQIYNAYLALEWAKRDGLEWLIHIDSDEILFAPHYHVHSPIYGECGLSRCPRDIHI